ncbi:protein kinase/lanthionine synthetase C family protein [Paraburkholderia sp. Se-20369]|nr:protein kinase/lanthionine synthetase C family protein [Paraburkholderia sp. Se-20369]
MLDLVVPILVRHDVPFKIARDPELLGMLNEGALGATQVGKFMTVYPPQDDETINALADELIAATHEVLAPKIQTDIHLGGAVYARYGSFDPAMKRDRLGLFIPIRDDHKGEYTVPFVAPDGIPNPFSAYIRATEPRSVRPIGPGYLIIGVMQAHAKGSVLLALDLSSQTGVRRVVLKEGRRHYLSDRYGREMWYRLENQARAHRDLIHTGVVPAAGELFEHQGSMYLPLELVVGRDLGARPALPFRALNAVGRSELLAHARGLIKAIRLIHEAGYAHRDLSMRNIRVTPEGKVMLLDLEISHRVADLSAPALTQGTPGFVSPQQLAGEPASFADDLFAFGSVLICATTGLDPQRVLFASGHDRAAQLEALSGLPQDLAKLAARCIAEDPDTRPSARAIEEVLSTFEIREPLGGASAVKQQVASLRSTVLDGLEWLVRGVSRDPWSGMWMSPDLESGEHASLNLVSNYRLYRSTNRGVSGVLYAIAKLHRFGFSVDDSGPLVERAVDWLLDHADTSDDQLPGLHFGEAGVAVAIAQSLAAGLIEPGQWTKPYLEEALSGPIDWPDLTHGAAGQGMAAIICAELLQQSELIQIANRHVRYLLDAQNADGSWRLPEGVRAMSGSIYTGFAHGVAGITTFLAKYASVTGSDAARTGAVRGGQWLLEAARTGPLGMSLWWPIVPDGEEAWAWWCHGAPGISLAFLALYELTGQGKYAAAVRACLRGHHEDVRYANMSQCHGLSGLGEILIEAHRVLGEEVWRARARSIGEVLALLGRREIGGASWLVENPYHPTSDLMIGCAGVVHFLARLEVVDPSFSMPLMPGARSGG